MFSRLLNPRNFMEHASSAAGPAVRRATSSLGEAENSLKMSKSDMLHTYWVNGLLSRPGTQIRNTMTNTATLVMRPLETLASAAVDTLSPGERTVYFRESLYETQGMIRGIQDALSVAKYLWSDAKTGAQQLNIPTNLFSSTKWEQSNPWTARGRDAWGGTTMQAIAKVITSPGQLLQATDNFFKIINYRASMYKYLAREGTGSGLFGDQLKIFIDKGMDVRNQFSQMARLDAEHATFTDAWQMEGMAEVDKILGNKYFRWLTPFRKAPLKIMGYSVERTPLGLMMSNIQQQIAAGGAARSEALGRMVAGTGVAAAVFAAVGDKLYGRAPLDSQQRALWEDSGKREYSMKIGDKFFKFDSFGPLGLVFRIFADYKDTIANFDMENDEDAVDILGQIGLQAAIPWLKAFEDQTFMRNIGELMHAIDTSVRYNDPRYLGQWGQNFGASFVWSGVSSMAHIFDDKRHNPSNPFEAVMARLPGLSQMVPVRYDLWGSPIKYDDMYGAEYIPLVYSQDANDPLARTLVEDYQFDVPRLKRLIQGVKLTTEEYAAYQQLAGKGAMGLPPLRSQVEGLLDALHDAPTEYVNTALHKLVVQYREAARAAMIEDPRFNLKERIMKKLEEEQQL